jgi:hypothetical protein
VIYTRDYTGFLMLTTHVPSLVPTCVATLILNTELCCRLLLAA